MNKLFSTFYMTQKLTKVIEISKGSSSCSYPQPDQTHHRNDNEHTVPTTLSIYLSCERTTLKMLELSIVHDSWKKYYMTHVCRLAWPGNNEWPYNRSLALVAHWLYLFKISFLY